MARTCASHTPNSNASNAKDEAARSSDLGFAQSLPQPDERARESLEITPLRATLHHQRQLNPNAQVKAATNWCDSRVNRTGGTGFDQAKQPNHGRRS